MARGKGDPKLHSFYTPHDVPARVDTTAKVGEIFFRVCFYSGPAYKTRPRKSKKIFFGVGGHDQRGRCRRLLAPYCFDTTDKATGQVAAVVGWLGHAAVEEWGWRKVKLRAADAGALQSLRIITLTDSFNRTWSHIRTPATCPASGHLP